MAECSRDHEGNGLTARVKKRTICGFALALFSLMAGCSSDEQVTQPEWNCTVVATGISSICICAKTAEPGRGSGECPPELSCCALGKGENGTPRCACLMGGGTCEISEGDQQVDGCPP